MLIGPKPTARKVAQVTVQLKGCKLAPGAYETLIDQVTIEETAGLMMSMATVRVLNPAFRVTDDDVWEEGAEMVIETGFPTTGTVRRHGKFFLTMPRFTFGAQSSVLLIGFGEEIKLGRTEKRRAFKKKSDGQIAREIAQENGFKADVEETKPVHDLVLQANENDYKFLSRRALLHGFVIFLQDGTLHFHAPRPEESGVTLNYNEGQASSLSAFSVESKTFMRGAEWEVTAVDPLRLEVVEEKSKDEDDDVTQAMLPSVKFPRKWDQIVKGDDDRPMRFMVNMGHEQERGALKEQVQGISEASRWVVSGRGTTFGLEQLRPNQLIDLVGLGRHSGKYYMTKVIHRIVGGTYAVEFDVTRSFTGGTQGNRCAVRPTVLKRAGVANFQSRSLFSQIFGR